MGKSYMIPTPLQYQLKRIDYHQRRKRIALLKTLNRSIKAEYSIPHALWEKLKQRILNMVRRAGSPLNAVPNQGAWMAKTFTVTTAGTPVNLSDTPIPDGYSVAIRGLIANGTGLIYVANSSANTAVAASRFILRAGDSIYLNINNLNLVWIDASVNGNGIEIVVEQ
jgi:hypothetical protein